MKLDVVWLTLREGTPGRGYWDQGMLEALFADELAPGVLNMEVEHHESVDGLEGAVVVFPGRAQVDYVDQLNAELKKLKWVILMITGDEEAVFPFEKIRHRNIMKWIMSPRTQDRYRGVFPLGTGFPPQAKILKDLLPREKDLDFFFSGQVTHERREMLAEQIPNLPTRNGIFNATKGFTQGFDHDTYYEYLSRAKVAFAPSGPETPDTFRLFEALEAGCVPIGDTRVPSYKDNTQFTDRYWTYFFGEEPPFPTVKDYSELPQITQWVLDNWDDLSVRVYDWWQKKKREMVERFKFSVEKVQMRILDVVPEDDYLFDNVTVLIPTSPIPDHPSTEMIEETVDTIRHHMPYSEIIIMMDGIRDEQKHYDFTYKEYGIKIKKLAKEKWTNVSIVTTPVHMHQAQMTRNVLPLVDTDVILFVEHDAPLVVDYEIPFTDMTKVIRSGVAHTIRLHHEASVLKAHRHMMFDEVTQSVDGVPLRRTMQWSQRPHLSATEYYMYILNKYFNPESRTMIEDVMHGAVHSVCEDHGLRGWDVHRLWLYHPEGNIKRSYHLDGRKDDPKFEMEIKPVSE